MQNLVDWLWNKLDSENGYITSARARAQLEYQFRLALSQFGVNNALFVAYHAFNSYVEDPRSIGTDARVARTTHTAYSVAVAGETKVLAGSNYTIGSDGSVASKILIKRREGLNKPTFGSRQVHPINSLFFLFFLFFFLLFFSSIIPSLAILFLMPHPLFFL